MARYILPLVLLFAAYAASCTTDLDCSLNGLCIPTPSPSLSETPSTCQCDPSWSGPTCNTLLLSPARRYTGFNQTNITLPSQFSTRGNSSWGGVILHDRTTPGLFHLIFDVFGHGCGLSAWRPTSYIARAESRVGPQGPYTWVQRVSQSFRHNAYAFWSEAEEKYLLWSIGVDVPEPTSCKGVDKTQFPNNISISAADDISGPWSDWKILVNGTNPAPWPLWSPQEPTAEVVLAAEDLRMYTAPRWNDAYTQLKVTVPWNTSDYSPTWTEDPFLWRDKRGNWHALAHWMIDISERGVKYPRVGAHLFSETLEGPWRFGEGEAYNSTVVFTDGSVETFNRRERPKLFFSEDGEMTPLYLVNGVQELNKSTSFTLIQPVGEKWREFEKGLGFS